MKILVASASRHGSTDGIGKVIAKTLRSEGLEVSFKRIEDVHTIEEYDAFVIGSAVYMGKWLKRAEQFVHEYHKYIATKPIWLFSSGPIALSQGSSTELSLQPAVLAAIATAHDHRLFGGKLQRKELGRIERILSRVVGAQQGDYRPWGQIVEWSISIAHTLHNKNRR